MTIIIRHVKSLIIIKKSYVDRVFMMRNMAACMLQTVRAPNILSKYVTDVTTT